MIQRERLVKDFEAMAVSEQRYLISENDYGPIDGTW